MLDLRRRFIVICGPNNALHGIGKDEVGQLVRRKKSTEECATIHSEDQNFLYDGKIVLVSIAASFPRVAEACELTVDVCLKRHVERDGTLGYRIVLCAKCSKYAGWS